MMKCPSGSMRFVEVPDELKPVYERKKHYENER